GGLDRAQAELPASIDALELVDTAVLEARAGVGDQVPHGAGRENLRRPGERHDPRADMHGDAAELAVYLLALAGVHAGAHVDAEPLNRYDNCRSARERTSRLGERREEPVPRRCPAPGHRGA